MKLFISFSGGETSAYMAYRLLHGARAYDDVVVLFANTGQEHEETLKFVDRCDKEFGLNVVWLEAVVHHGERKGNGFKIVNFNSASRSGEPFEDSLKKYGIPNKAGPFCTRSLKLEPMLAYIKSIGWKKGEYKTAIGIRADEMQRVSVDAIRNKSIIYPLVGWGIRKDDIRFFWSNQYFRLNIHEHYGNCLWCWKKSNRKLYTLATENSQIFDFPARMENLYGLSGGHSDKSKPRVFFRGNTSTKELIEAAKSDFIPFVDGYRVSVENYDAELDAAGGCSESCDIFSI